MKRIMLVCLALLALCMPAGCGTKNNESAIVNLPNPVRDSSHEEILEKLGINLRIPDEAVDVTYSIIDIEGDNDIAQAVFTLDGAEYTHRIKPCAEFEDISGAYYEWEKSEERDVSYCDGKLQFNEDKQGVYLWFDVVPGLMYSVYMQNGASLDLLTEIAGKLFVEAKDVP